MVQTAQISKTTVLSPPQTHRLLQMVATTNKITGQILTSLPVVPAPTVPEAARTAQAWA